MQAARFMDVAALGGMVVCELGLMQRVLDIWNRCVCVSVCVCVCVRERERACARACLCLSVLSMHV
jgi:hypothetical protein